MKVTIIKRLFKENNSMRKDESYHHNSESNSSCGQVDIQKEKG